MNRTYLLDTCAFLSAVTKGLGALGKTARTVMAHEQNELVMSSISLVEIGILRSIHRLQVDFQAIQNALKGSARFHPSVRSPARCAVFRSAVVCRASRPLRPDDYCNGARGALTNHYHRP